MNRAERPGLNPARTPSNIGWDMNLTAPPTACGNRANNAGDALYAAVFQMTFPDDIVNMC